MRTAYNQIWKAYQTCEAYDEKTDIRLMNFAGCITAWRPNSRKRLKTRESDYSGNVRKTPCSWPIVPFRDLLKRNRQALTAPRGIHWLVIQRHTMSAVQTAEIDKLLPVGPTIAKLLNVNTRG